MTFFSYEFCTTDCTSLRIGTCCCRTGSMSTCCRDNSIFVSCCITVLTLFVLKTCCTASCFCISYPFVSVTECLFSIHFLCSITSCALVNIITLFCTCGSYSFNKYCIAVGTCYIDCCCFYIVTN